MFKFDWSSGRLVCDLRSANVGQASHQAERVEKRIARRRVLLSLVCLVTIICLAISGVQSWGVSFEELFSSNQTSFELMDNLASYFLLVARLLLVVSFWMPLHQPKVKVGASKLTVMVGVPGASDNVLELSLKSEPGCALRYPGISADQAETICARYPARQTDQFFRLNDLQRIVSFLATPYGLVLKICEICLLTLPILLIFYIPFDPVEAGYWS